jgi:hypothetical protein
MNFDYRDQWLRRHAALIITCKWLEEYLRLSLLVTVTVLALAGTAPCQQPLELRRKPDRCSNCRLNSKDAGLAQPRSRDRSFRRR